MKQELEINNQNKIEHLKMIQNIIDRMGWNSFYIKGLLVTLTVASVYLISKILLNNGFENQFWWFFLVLGGGFLFFTSLMWYLDGFFLLQERLYRKLYNETRKRKDKIDFSLNANKFKCKKSNKMQICKCEKKCKSTIFYVIFSKTLWVFYGFFFLFNCTIMILGGIL